MRIVSRDQLLKLPPNTLYCTYEPSVFGELLIKMETLDTGNDWIYQDISSSLDCLGSNDLFDKLWEAEEKGISLDMNFHLTGRDGCFDYDQLYVVYEQKDIKQLIDRLKECIRNDK